MSLRSKSYKDKTKLLHTRNEQRKRYYKKTQKHIPKKWEDEEVELLFNCEMTDTKLSNYLQRSVQSIQAKRCKCNKEKNDRPTRIENGQIKEMSLY